MSQFQGRLLFKGTLPKVNIILQNMLIIKISHYTLPAMIYNSFIHVSHCNSIVLLSLEGSYPLFLQVEHKYFFFKYSWLRLYIQHTLILNLINIPKRNYNIVLVFLATLLYYLGDLYGACCLTQLFRMLYWYTVYGLYLFIYFQHRQKCCIKL